jgi:predicted ATP-dependent endonuclease of OLD family
MHIKYIAVRNFRLLSEVNVLLAATNGDGDGDPDVTTVIVGRNNSGKTSVTTIEGLDRHFLHQYLTFEVAWFHVSETARAGCSHASDKGIVSPVQSHCSQVNAPYSPSVPYGS